MKYASLRIRSHSEEKAARHLKCLVIMVVELEVTAIFFMKKRVVGERTITMSDMNSLPGSATRRVCRVHFLALAPRNDRSNYRKIGHDAVKVAERIRVENVFVLVEIDFLSKKEHCTLRRIIIRIADFPCQRILRSACRSWKFCSQPLLNLRCVCCALGVVQ